MFSFHYLNDAPIISVQDHPDLEGNVNGPSLIAAPGWLANPPGKYLLYFAHHEGRSIRLAASDNLTGPWKLVKPGPLDLEHSMFAEAAPSEADLDPEAKLYIEAGSDGLYPHIASPDVRVDEHQREIRMYYHGRLANGLQRTRLALSRDGLNFTARLPVLGLPYMRLFPHGGWYYAIAMPGQTYRSRDGLDDFEAGPRLTREPIRHHAILEHEGQCYVLWTRIGDRPERILLSELNIAADWQDWRLGATHEIHRAEKPWEGAILAPRASQPGACMEPVNQLRDPAIFQENGKIYLLYAVAGEQGIAIGELRRT